MVQDEVEALDQHADSLEEKLGFQWFARKLGNFAAQFQQAVAWLSGPCHSTATG